MKKLLFLLFLIPSLAFAQGSGAHITQESQHPLRHKANRTVTDTTNFNNNLGVGDTSVQDALDTLDNLAIVSPWTRTAPYTYPTTITDNVGIGFTAPLGWLQVGTNPSAPILIIEKGGNIGIGKTTPTQKLDIIGNMLVSGTIAGNILTGTNVTSGADPGHTHGAGSITEADPLAILATGTRGLSGNWYNANYNIGTLGNIGIGNTNPTTRLLVTGNITADTGTFTTLNIGSLSGFLKASSGLVSTASIDISADTNLSGDTENVLTGDALSIGAAITRDTEWNTIDFLTGTTTGSLSGEIVTGTAPGGELGGTWASPTIDSTHSGSAHHSAVTLGVGNDSSLALSSQELTLTVAKDLVTTSPLTGGTDNILTGADADITIALGTVGVANGGTGVTTFGTTYGVITAGTSAGSPLQVIAGVGTSGQVLTSNGAGALPTFQAATGGGTSFDGTAPQSVLYIKSGNTAAGSALIVTDGSNLSVGIGTTQAAARLYIKGAGTTTGFALRVADSTPTDRLVVLDSGSVGIGTTNPLNTLDVTGNVRITGNLGIGTTSPTNSPLAIQTTLSELGSFNYVQPANETGAQFRFKAGAAGATNRGYIGITKNGSGGAIAYTQEVADYLFIMPTTGIHIGPSQPPELTIAGGNVGIGTTRPVYTLQLVVDSAAKPGVGGLWTVPSDMRLKDPASIRPYTTGLALINQLNPVYFKYNELSGYDTTTEQIGFIAQDMETKMPSAVKHTHPKLKPTDPENPDDILGLNIGELLYANINAIKELKAEINVLVKRIEVLEAR